MSAAEKAIAALEEELSDLRPRVWTGAAAEIIMPVAAPLAAVARAAMAVDRTWRALTDEDRPQYTGSCLDEFLSHEDPFVTAYHAALAAMHAALDALEAAAEGVV